ncbi:hypothetical protein QV12_22280 [Pseudomonas putida]|nr:hypothetical protein QV12_22280 [Pseudomonas putida]
MNNFKSTLIVFCGCIRNWMARENFIQLLYSFSSPASKVIMSGLTHILFVKYFKYHIKNMEMQDCKVAY